MNEQALGQFGNKLVQVLLSEKIIPAQVLVDLGDLVSGGDAGFRRTMRAAWEKENQARQQAGASTRNIELPIHLTGGIDQDTAEEELGRFLPEEKILINKEIFRQKLKGLDFSSLDARKEQALIEDLKTDSIGLSREETVLYFNLIKLSALSGTLRQKAPSKPVATVDYPGTILSLAESHFQLTPANLTRLNMGRPIAREQILNIVEVSIRGNKINPKVLAILLGHKTDKYLRKLQKFLETTVTMRGEKPEEVMQHFGFYLLVSTADENLLKTLDLSTPLASFVTNKIGRMRQIYYVSMLFAITFFFVLLSQVTEISGKFHESNAEQQGKLMKLYQSDERIGMIVQNAVNLANRRIADFKVESREVQVFLKRFLAANADIVTPADLFTVDYRMEGAK